MRKENRISPENGNTHKKSRLRRINFFTIVTKSTIYDHTCFHIDDHQNVYWNEKMKNDYFVVRWKAKDVEDIQMLWHVFVDLSTERIIMNQQEEKEK